MAGGLKRYFVINGRMIGQQLSPGGSRVDFMTDAQGSVTGTVGSNGAVQKTYRFTPYGQFLSETGTGPDPDFRWNGVSHYYNTGLQHADYYARAKAYSSTEGRWTTVDGLGGYAVPLASTCDLAGVKWSSVHAVIIREPSHGNCGAWGTFQPLWVNWNIAALRQLTSADGWIIQEILRPKSDWPACVKSQQPCQIPEVHYWEGWYLEDNRVLSGSDFKARGTPDDAWYDPFQCNCHQGSKVTKGWKKFFPVAKNCWQAWQWTPGDGQSGRGILLGGPMPAGWTQTGPFREVQAGFDCCSQTCKGKECFPKPTSVTVLNA